MHKVLVFLVDDHPVAREGIRRLLELDERISVVGEANHGEEALERVAATSPQVVLMDIKLPGMDGIQATKRLIAQNPQLRVVVLSSVGDRYLAPAIEAGACGYILKTATQAELVSAVLRAAEGQSPIDPELTHLLLSRQAVQLKRLQSRAFSNRQQEILRLMADGMASSDIAARLSVSRATLTRELRHIFDLLGVDDRTHAIAQAYKQDLL